jgi:NitT/TauT family transport system substrate-binding protein
MRTLLALLTVFALVRVPLPAAADDALTVIGSPTPAAFYEVLDHVAQRAGFFKDEHLIVDKEYVTVGANCAQLVATGKADICSGSFEAILQGYEKGLRMQFFLSRDPRYEYVIGVLDDSPIRTLADFKGTTLGEINTGSSTELAAQATLMGAGLRKSDISFVPIGLGPQAITALTTKKVDGAAFAYPELASYEVGAHLKFRYFWNPILRDIGNVGYSATPATIQTKSDQLGRYARAIVKAAILIRANPPLAARYFLEGAGIRVTPEALENETRLLILCEDQLPGIDPASKKIGAIPPLGMQIYSQFLNTMGLTSQTVPVDAVLTDRFIDYANDFDHKAFVAHVKNIH